MNLQKKNSAVLMFSFLFFLFQVPACGSGNSETGRYTPSTARAAKSDKGKSPGIYLTLHKEQYQGAFSILIPKGWNVEGGMVPSGVPWNVVDLIEGNIKFRVSSPDKKSFFGWYPKFYFQDPAVSAQSSMGYIQKPAGDVLNGVWLFPYMNIKQYVQNIVFRYFAEKEFKNPRILGSVKDAPELKPWIPKIATQYQAGYVNFECTISGTPVYGRIYTIIYNYQNILWTTVGTWGLVAPKSKWKKEEGMMEMCIRSFRLDPQWVTRASKAQRQRGEKYNQVIRQINQIDQEIQKNRVRTNSDIMHENYKLLTGRIETYDPANDKVKYLPSYNHAYTDGQGNYFLRDYDDGTLPFENASEWRKLEVVDRLKR